MNPTSTTIRVAVLDDHRLVADGLAAVLEGHGFEIVVVASSWEELLASDVGSADVTIIDLHLGDGILIESKVRALATMGTSTVVVSRHADRVIGMTGGEVVYDGPPSGLNGDHLDTIYGDRTWQQ